MVTDIRKRLIRALFLVFMVFLAGTMGFYFLLDGLSLIDTFYLTVITLTTVGYGDITPHSNMPEDGNPYVIKTFAILLILFGMGSFLYTVGIVTEYIVSGEMGKENKRRRMQKLIANLRGHYIICGAGETGTHMVAELEKTHRSYVVVEKSSERISALQQQFEKFVYVQGDATDDLCIGNAGLEHAAGLVASLPDEKDNLFIVVAMSQKKREAGDKFKLVAQATHYDKMAPKIRGAGADVVISPSFISGRRMVSEMFRPAVTTFLDRMLRDNRAVMRIEEATVEESSPLKGQTLAHARIPQKTGLIIVAVRKKGGNEFISNPKADQVIDVGDALIFLGDMPRIMKLRRLACGVAA